MAYDPNVPLWTDDGTGPVRNPDLAEADFQDGLAQLQAQNLDALWAAATAYQESQISGAAYGLVTLGVMKDLPKSQAVMAWINSVWALYYSNKPQVGPSWNAALYDFSACGPMPFSVPQLMAEVMPG